ncbi:MAG: spore maturation protein, partial [Candidatus Marinimicrobia bacterium]|nr:spore maturation protein [Candidatus Neomarinimicrobiota bacterium]
MIESFVQGVTEVSRYIIPLLLVGIPFYGLIIKKVKVYETFVVGAK